MSEAALIAGVWTATVIRSIPISFGRGSRGTIAVTGAKQKIADAAPRSTFPLVALTQRPFRQVTSGRKGAPDLIPMQVHQVEIVFLRGQM